jgi:hypothetical protein
MSHLTPDEIVDALDNALTGERQAHWQACDACRAQTEQLRDLLRDVQPSDVPDPSPLFWTHFATRVRQGIDNDTTLARPWWAVLRWKILMPAAAAALVAVALVVGVPRQIRHVVPHSRGVSNVSAVVDGYPPLVDDTFDDRSWRLVVDLVDDLDLDTAPQGGLVVTPGLVDRALRDLRPAEREELLRLLRAELGDPES